MGPTGLEKYLLALQDNLRADYESRHPSTLVENMVKCENPPPSTPKLLKKHLKSILLFIWDAQLLYANRSTAKRVWASSNILFESVNSSDLEDSLDFKPVEVIGTKLIQVINNFSSFD